MRIRWWVALAVTPWIAACSGQSDSSHEDANTPAAETNTAEANTLAAEPSAPDAAHDPATGTSGAVVLAPPALGGLPEVRYYTLGGA